MVLAFVLFAIALLLLQAAKPQMGSFLDDHWKTSVRASWDLGFVNLSFWAFLADLAVCCLALTINGMTHSKVGGRSQRLLIGITFVSLITLVAHQMLIPV